MRPQCRAVNTEHLIDALVLLLTSLPEATALRKVRNRLVAFLGVLYVAAFIDRVNVGFAAAQMHRDLGFSASVYGLGAGIFFIGYALFEIPSNLILHRVGARRWLARIMITWALLAAGMVFVRGATSFYVLRFLLGVAEAGFFPGVLYYLTLWVPRAERARLIGLFMVAVPVSTAVAGPLSSLLLRLDGVGGLAGWQWLFLSETIPSLVLGMLTLRLLVDTPAQARWLTPAERGWLCGRLAAEAAAAPARAASPLVALATSRVLALSLCYFGADLGLYGVVFWIPQILADTGIAASNTGYLVAIPYAAGAAAMLWWSRHSDRARERTRHVAAAAFLGCIGVAACTALASSAWLSVLALTVGVSGTLAMLPVFWTLPAALLRGAAAAAGIALINTVGNVGGFVGPYAVGWLRQQTGSFTWGLLVVAASLLLTGLLALVVGHDAAAEYAEIPDPGERVHNAAPEQP